MKSALLRGYGRSGHLFIIVYNVTHPYHHISVDWERLYKIALRLPPPAPSAVWPWGDLAYLACCLLTLILFIFTLVFF